jgi:HEAT repeat protein
MKSRPKPDPETVQDHFEWASPDGQPDPVASALERLGLSHPDELLPLLQSSSRKRAADACQALGLTRKKAYSGALLALVKGKRRSLWMVAAASLSMLESKRVIQPLIQLLLDSARPAKQREAAAYALAFTWSGLADARYGPPAGDAFVAVLRNSQETPGLRGQVAEGLAYLYGPCAGAARDRRGRAYRQAGESLTAALGDPAAEVRFWCVFALGSMRYRPALSVLQGLAQTDEGRFGNWWTVREEAADAIERISGRRPPLRMKQ